MLEAHTGLLTQRKPKPVQLASGGRLIPSKASTVAVVVVVPAAVVVVVVAAGVVVVVVVLAVVVVVGAAVVVLVVVVRVVVVVVGVVVAIMEERDRAERSNLNKRNVLVSSTTTLVALESSARPKEGRTVVRFTVSTTGCFGGSVGNKNELLLSVNKKSNKSVAFNSPKNLKSKREALVPRVEFESDKSELDFPSVNTIGSTIIKMSNSASKIAATTIFGFVHQSRENVCGCGRLQAQFFLGELVGKK